MGGHGYHFGNLDRRLQDRFWRLVSSHVHSVNAAVNGLTALPGTALPFAATRAMSRFLRNGAVGFHALLEPALDAVRTALADSPSPFALVVHDWCMFQFHTHAGKADRLQRTHANDLGYELGTALVVDAADGRPLGPAEFRLRTGAGMRTTRSGGAALPPGHVDELLGAMDESPRWQLGKIPVHLVDREADSVGHYRAWRAAGHRFLVRADDRFVRWRGREVRLAAVAAGLGPQFAEVRTPSGDPELVAVRTGIGRLKVAEAEVVLDRPAKTRRGDKQVEVPGPAIPLRLVVSRVVDELGVVRAEWLLLTDVPAAEAAAATVARWSAWRWRIETYHKLMKSSGMNAEEWQQERGDAFLRRLLVASMAALTVWHLGRDESPDAARLRTILVRLSGRQMGRGVDSTPAALLAGLEKLLGLEDLLQTEDLAEVLELARKVLPTLFRSG